jgi:hypothetical protein
MLNLDRNRSLKSLASHQFDVGTELNDFSAASLEIRVTLLPIVSAQSLSCNRLATSHKMTCYQIASINIRTLKQRYGYYFFFAYVLLKVSSPAQ